MLTAPAVTAAPGGVEVIPPHPGSRSSSRLGLREDDVGGGTNNAQTVGVTQTPALTNGQLSNHQDHADSLDDTADDEVSSEAIDVVIP